MIVKKHMRRIYSKEELNLRNQSKQKCLWWQFKNDLVAKQRKSGWKDTKRNANKIFKV